MARLRELRVTMMPKLDINKTQWMLKKLENVLKNSTERIEKFANKANKFSSGMSEGLELLETMEEQVKKLCRIEGMKSREKERTDLDKQGVMRGEKGRLVESREEGEASNKKGLFEGCKRKSALENKDKARAEELGKAKGEKEFLDLKKELESLHEIMKSRFSDKKEKKAAWKRKSALLESYFENGLLQGQEKVQESDIERKDVQKVESNLIKADEKKDVSLGIWEKGIFLAAELNKETKIRREKELRENENRKAVMGSSHFISMIEKWIKQMMNSLEKPLDNFSMNLELFEATLNKFSTASDGLRNLLKNKEQSKNKRSFLETSYEDQTREKIEYG